MIKCLELVMVTCLRLQNLDITKNPLHPKYFEDTLKIYGLFKYLQ